MQLAALLWLFGVATALKTPPPFVPNLDQEITVAKLPSRGPAQKESPLEVTDNVIQLKRAVSDAWSPSAIYIQALRKQAGVGRALVSMSAQSLHTLMYD